ncbi:MAG TPA: PEP-CTERM sorting domain-containing protein [Phycisphaerae bacterium]|nr:PEP-CTERM sorting domain-containing protein [Phycisphaerae bacterium]HRY71373.1 PEP-CTERM sorting domain-containing protein [Phycisphaerae bacterium]HSA29849.1 PEP-CTERM sorting domain-containing protein [Phycisphaerae bacterium]
MKRRLLCAASLLALMCSGAALAAGIHVAVDIDSARRSGSDTSGTFVTQSGFTSWDMTTFVRTPDPSLTFGDVKLELFGFSADNQSRGRANGGGGGSYDALLADFVYNEGASGRAVALRITGLDVGTYAMQSWHYDSEVSGENYIQIEARNRGDSSSTVILVDQRPFGEEPASFTFDVTAVGQVKEIVFREDDLATVTDPTDSNRARLNGFTLTPEPSSLILLLLATGAFWTCRRG